MPGRTYFQYRGTDDRMPTATVPVTGPPIGFTTAFYNENVGILAHVGYATLLSVKIYDAATRTYRDLLPDEDIDANKHYLITAPAPPPPGESSRVVACVGIARAAERCECACGRKCAASRCVGGS
jgi:hypothetical protein